jgi:hypothetical protein
LQIKPLAVTRENRSAAEPTRDLLAKCHLQGLLAPSLSLRIGEGDVINN